MSGSIRLHLADHPRVCGGARVRGAKKDTTPFPSFLLAHPTHPRTRFADDQFSFHPDRSPFVGRFATGLRRT